MVTAEKPKTEKQPEPVVKDNGFSPQGSTALKSAASEFYSARITANSKPVDPRKVEKVAQLRSTARAFDSSDDPKIRTAAQWLKEQADDLDKEIGARSRTGVQGFNSRFRDECPESTEWTGPYASKLRAQLLEALSAPAYKEMVKADVHARISLSLKENGEAIITLHTGDIAPKSV